MDMRDSKLPWQFVLLGFMGFGAIFAVMLLVFSFVPDMAMRKSTAAIVRFITIPYLGICIGASPYLIRSGRRAFNALNPVDSDGVRHVPPVPPGKRLAVSSISLAAGILLSLHSYNQVNPTTGGRYTIYAGLIGVGLFGIVSALLASSSEHG